MFLPWDKDLSFGSHYRLGASTDNDFFSYEHPMTARWHNDLIRKFLRTPELKEQLDNRMVYLIEEVFTLEYFREQVNHITAAVGQIASTPPIPGSFELHGQNHFSNIEHYPYHAETILDFVELRSLALH